MSEKVCIKCHTVQPLENFGKQVYNSDGLKSVCKACNKQYMKQYRERKGEDYQEKERAYARNYRYKKQEQTPEHLLRKLELAVERCQLSGVPIPNQIFSSN